MDQENLQKETIIPEEVEDSKGKTEGNKKSTNSSVDTDWIIKCLIIWLLPVVGGLIFMNDTDMILQHNARRALITFALAVILTVIASIGAYWIWVFVAIYAIIKMSDKKPFALPLIDEICKKVWK